MAMNIVKSFAGLADGLESWLNDKKKWTRLYDGSWQPLSRWLEDLQQANQFLNTLIRITSKVPELGGALNKAYNKVAESAQKIDARIENSPDLQRWSSICRQQYRNQVPDWIASDIEDFERKVADLLAGIRDTRYSMNLPEIPTKHVSLAKAAKWFKRDPRTLKKSIDSGTIKARQISARRWEFDLDQVTDFNPTLRADADPTERHNTPSGSADSQ